MGSKTLSEIEKRNANTYLCMCIIFNYCKDQQMLTYKVYSWMVPKSKMFSLDFCSFDYFRTVKLIFALILVWKYKINNRTLITRGWSEIRISFSYSGCRLKEVGVIETRFIKILIYQSPHENILKNPGMQVNNKYTYNVMYFG